MTDAMGFCLTRSDLPGPYQCELSCDSTHSVASWGMIQHGSIINRSVPNWINKAEFIGSILSWAERQCAGGEETDFGERTRAFERMSELIGPPATEEHSFHGRLNTMTLTGRAQVLDPKDRTLVYCRFSLWHRKSHSLCCLYLSAPSVKSGLYFLIPEQRKEPKIAISCSNSEWIRSVSRLLSE